MYAPGSDICTCGPWCIRKLECLYKF